MEKEELYPFSELFKLPLAKTYGEEKAKEVLEKGAEIYKEYLELTDDKGNEAVKKHIEENIVPVAASYKALQVLGIGKDEALKFVVKVMHELVDKISDKFYQVQKIPFLYSFVRLMGPRVMRKSYPDIGWDVEWVRNDKEEVAFNCRACVYLDTTTVLGCPELCEFFCENDNISYNKLAPKMIFERTKTLATGGDCCDFKIKNGKYAK